MCLIVYSNDHAPLTVRLIYSSSKLRTVQMMIFSLVAMIGLAKCCITSACLQWLCHSGERIVARGPLVWLSFCHLFPLNYFRRDTFISFKLCRTFYYCKIQFKFDIGNHLPNFGWVMALFHLSSCWCVDIGFRSITFAGMHWFHWKFTEGYINVRYRSSPILVIIRKILALWPFFDLVIVVVLILVSTQ